MKNPNAYKFGSINKRVKIEVTVMLDAVPGWGHNPVDHIRLMFRDNPYIVEASVIGD